MIRLGACTYLVNFGHGGGLSQPANQTTATKYDLVELVWNKVWDSFIRANNTYYYSSKAFSWHYIGKYGWNGIQGPVVSLPPLKR